MLSAIFSAALHAGQVSLVVASALWHPVQLPPTQVLQDFPAFLSFIILTMISATIKTKTEVMMIVATIMASKRKILFIKSAQLAFSRVHFLSWTVVIYLLFLPFSCRSLGEQPCR